MISDVKAAITGKLMELYPAGYGVYDEFMPEAGAAKPYFLVSVTNQIYNKRINNKYSSTLSLDITFHSDQEAAVRIDAITKQEELLRGFDSVSNYKVKNKAAKITDNVLHFTFDIQYYEMSPEEFILMQQQTIHTTI